MVISCRKWGGKKHLTLPQQYLFLSKNPITNGSGDLTNQKLTWRFDCRPLPISRIYTLRIEYRRGLPPDVFVEEPDLELLANGRELPHVYHNPLRLCLYLPHSNQWLGSMRLDKTIAPWAVIWLYYYEEWLVSDEWKGGGEHPSEIHAQRRTRRSRRLLYRNT